MARATAAKAALGDRVFVLGHHYQRDEVIQFADVTGDSFKLAREAAARPDAEFIVFCGVHFMAESADILTGRRRSRWSCPTSPPAARWPTWPCCRRSRRPGSARRTSASPTSTVPVTYMNSSADIKGFVGRNGGVVCTSSNAKRALTWAFERGQQVFFLPDQHLGRNTAVLEMGFDARRLRALRPAQARRRPDRASSCATRR